MIYGKLLHKCWIDIPSEIPPPAEETWLRWDDKTDDPYRQGWFFPAGTPVECNEFDTIEDLMREQLFGASAGTYWLLPNGEERCLEPDVVDFGAGI